MAELPALALEAIASIRKRPGMYFGSVHEPPHALLWDVLANALDGYLAGRARSIEITLHADDAISIRDDGPGMPLEILMRALSSPHRTPTLDGHRPHAHLGGLNLGLFTVAAACDRLEVTTRHDGVEHHAVSSRGALYDPTSRPTSEASGTLVWLRPDPVIFGRRVFDRPKIIQQIEAISDMSEGLRIVLRDEGWEPARERRGLGSRLGYAHPRVEIDGHHAHTTVRAALGWSGGDVHRVESFVGYVDTVHGGTHVTGLLRGLDDVARRLKVTDGLRKGLHACLVVFTPDIHWGQPTKTQVTNPELVGVVRTIVRDAMTSHIDAHPEVLEALRQRPKR